MPQPMIKTCPVCMSKRLYVWRMAPWDEIDQVACSSCSAIIGDFYDITFDVEEGDPVFMALINAFNVACEEGYSVQEVAAELVAYGAWEDKSGCWRHPARLTP